MTAPEKTECLTPSSDGPQPEEELISIARIARPQGIKGEVIADLLTDFPERFALLEAVSVITRDGKVSQLRLTSSRLHNRRIVLKFANCDSVEQADLLREARVMIPRQELVTLPDDSWFEFDLVGCEVITKSGTRVGLVTDVQHYGAAPLLNVRSEESPQPRDILIPLAFDICIEVNPADKRIVIDPPAGLLEL